MNVLRFKGHFALTGLLIDLLRKSSPSNPLSRIVTVSSQAHLFADKNIASDPRLIIVKDNYEPWTAYGNSKLANILFTKSLAKKLSTSGHNVVPLSCHPGEITCLFYLFILFSCLELDDSGGCRTELGRYIVDPESIKTLPPYVWPLAAVVGVPLSTTTYYLYLLTMLSLYYHYFIQYI
jgi:NAD(P)-dependent dehydrogenase (short-subunit alcohol dehydrogenase family)